MFKAYASGGLIAVALMLAAPLAAQEHRPRPDGPDPERGRSEAAQRLHEVEGRRDEEARQLRELDQDKGDEAREKAKAWDDPSRPRSDAEKEAARELKKGKTEVEERSDMPERGDLAVPPEMKERARPPTRKQGPN